MKRLEEISIRASHTPGRVAVVRPGVNRSDLKEVEVFLSLRDYP